MTIFDQVCERGTGVADDFDIDTDSIVRDHRLFRTAISVEVNDVMVSQYLDITVDIQIVATNPVGEIRYTVGGDGYDRTHEFNPTVGEQLADIESTELTVIRRVSG